MAGSIRRPCVFLAVSAVISLCTGCTPARPTASPGVSSVPAAPPDSPVIPAAPRFTPGDIVLEDAAVSSGLKFRWGHADLSHINILDGIGHGCAFLDYDGDGRADILLVAGGGARLFHNNGDGTFQDVTSNVMPSSPLRCHFLGCAIADYDGDGRPDIFLTGYGSTALYHNEGAGRFRDVTRGSGLEARGPYDWTTSAAWADVDGDGRLDLYVCRYVEFTPRSKQFCGQKALDGTDLQMDCNPTIYRPQKGSLFRSEGSGRFRDITVPAGLADSHGNGLGCMFCDFNQDGLPDLYIANDLKPADLYVNLGLGRFKNIGAESATALGADGGMMSGMGVDWGDYDNDGQFDLLAANYARQPKSLFHNEGHSLFTNRSYTSGLGAASLLPLTFGSNFVDIDNDGWLDIVLVNGHVDSLAEHVDNTTSYFQKAQLFRNLGNGRFTDITAAVGPDFTRKIVGRGIAIGDYDGDGREDLLIVDDEGAPLLLHNKSDLNNHWISLRCLWKPSKTDAIGARVTTKAGALRQIREVRASGSYLSTNDPAVHFGLGPNPKVETLEIRWPDGKHSVYHDIPVNHSYEVMPSYSEPHRMR